MVRLKGGDPSVFGRVGEEADYLEAQGVAVEIVPGVTAASAAAAQFAFPLTHRGEARRIVLATATLTNGALQTEGWGALADAQSTVALYMARDCAGIVAARLMAEGRAGSTPVVAVENAGRAEARLIEATLADLGAVVEAAGCVGPVVLVIGEVTARAARFAAPISRRA